MKKILIPTDFSDNTWSSIVYALKLYQFEVCKFFLLHANPIHAAALANMSGDMVESMRERPLKELNNLKEQLEEADANANHEFHVILKLESLVNAVKSTVDQFDIDLIVMGTKGATGAKEIFLGSNTVKVINHMKLCPVLIVPEEYDFVVPKQIAFPTDFHRFFSGYELKPITDIAELHDSKIRVVHVNVEKELDDIQEFNMKALKEFLENFEHSFHWMPDFAKKSEAIHVFLEELEIDMLAMVNYKHSLIEKITKEPVIKKLGFHPKTPFLVVPS